MTESGSKYLRWFARSWGAMVLIFLLFMVCAHVWDSITGETQSDGFQSASELISFIFFPIGTMVGIALALWSKLEGPGSIIGIVSMTGFFALRPEMITDLTFVILLAPPLLFFIHWLDAKRRKLIH